MVPTAAFVDIVRDRLGERAAYHVGTVLPEHIRLGIASLCEYALVFTGRRFNVSDRRRYVLDMRHCVNTPGVLSLFFDWTGVWMGGGGWAGDEDF